MAAWVKNSSNVAAIDAHLQQLTQTAKKSSYSKQKSSLRVEFRTFLASLPSVRSIYSVTPQRCFTFFGLERSSQEKIVHVANCVNASNRMHLIAVVPSDLHKKLLIPILGNFTPSSMKPVTLATGIVCWVLVIVPLLLQSKVILRVYLRSNCVHISSLSRRSHFFY